MMPGDGREWRKTIFMLQGARNISFEYLVNQPITVLQEIIEDVVEVSGKRKG